MNRIDIGLYKILRKLGVQRDEISPETSFTKDLFFDDRDWQCFLFLLESNMQVDLNEAVVTNINTVGDAAMVLKQQKHYQYN
jgi:acyl carrier protein